LYASPDIIRVIKSVRLKWAGHTACMGEIKIHIKLWSENLKVRYHLGRSRCRWSIILQ